MALPLSKYSPLLATLIRPGANSAYSDIVQLKIGRNSLIRLLISRKFYVFNDLAYIQSINKESPGAAAMTLQQRIIGKSDHQGCNISAMKNTCRFAILVAALMPEMGAAKVQLELLELPAGFRV